MMKSNYSKVLVWLISASLALMPCCKPEPERLRLACVVDLTASVESEAMKEAFEALRAVIANLGRGDSISIIPVTGDALTDAQGRILRFSVSDERKPYDEDLLQLADEAESKLHVMQSEAAQHPYGKSDFLGAIEVAREELSTSRENSRSAIIILGDLIQDDALYNFKREPRLASEQQGAALARKITESREVSLNGARVFLGLLRSLDLKGLPQARRASIHSFWVEYFRLRGASQVDWATDGPGHLAGFVKQVREAEPGDPESKGDSLEGRR